MTIAPRFINFVGIGENTITITHQDGRLQYIQFIAVDGMRWDDDGIHVIKADNSPALSQDQHLTGREPMLGGDRRLNEDR